MAFWRRINQSKLQLISNQYRRFYFQAPFTSSLHQTRIRVLEKPVCSIEDKPSFFYSNVRSFAAPVQAIKNKKAEAGKEKPRLNKQITASVVRLVTEDGQHSVVSIQEALQQARKKGLDLVEVQKMVNPPVCRLMDYNKEMYRRRQKEKEIAKNKAGETIKKGVCKIRFTGKIVKNDLKLKAENVIRLMERGYRVKCMAMGQGKEHEVEDLGGILSRLTNLIEDVCVVESGPKVEKTNAYVIVKHVKFGPTKKGGGKKSKVETSTESATDNQSPVLPNDESTESGSESEDTMLSDEDELPMSSPTQMRVESTGSNTSQSCRPDTSPEIHNRYKRSEPRNPSNPQFPYPRREQPNMGQSTRESVRSEPWFQNPPRQPPQNMGQDTSESVRSEPWFHNPPRQPPQNMGQNTRESVRSEPWFQYPPRQPPQNMGQNTRETVRSAPQFPYQRRQPPQNMNATSSVQHTKQVENESSKPPSNNSLSFGIFSGSKANSSGKQAPDAPMSNEGNRYASLRNRGMNGNGANQNTRGSQFDGDRKPDSNMAGQDRYGSTSNRKP
ncbi:hypothetical protein ES288_D02G278200v1 [Gossypium darwinii]|uniref:Translation initiation factor 3 N-terminal domain-containing protein n=1 Tax=Gossypium darwinii TaxID=34276 RepID=A0A5D2DIG4_GOSDA|nr:hypothetical protein ES288_D02G278200v1 [Gossypium darwinii]